MVTFSEVTLAGTVKVCRVSLSNPKVWVTVTGVVAPAAGTPMPVTAGTPTPAASAVTATDETTRTRRRRPGTRPVTPAASPRSAVIVRSPDVI